MSTYKIGKVYKIIHNQSDIVYVGSTMQKRLRDRWQAHKNAYKVWLNGKATSCSIYLHMKEHGIENFKMILIEEYEVCDRKHLQTWEQLWINKLKCVNKQNVFQMLPKHHLYLRCKKYREANKEEIAQKNKKYRENNKVEIKKKQKQKIKCECGSVVRRSGLARHKRSKKHQKFLFTKALEATPQAGL